MKPTDLFSQSTSALLCVALFTTSVKAQTGNILRGGGTRGGSPAEPVGGGGTPASAVAARNNAQNLLARTAQSLEAVKAMQNAARSVAAGGANNLGANPLNPGTQLPDVPNGLGNGGLQVAPGVGTDPTKWTGADLPTSLEANGKTNVTIRQTAEQALLNWQTFNVGKDTNVNFDQSQGGADVAKWIAFNRIQDPTGNPTQILGSIQAQGQVYLINGNGVIFGGSSQVNARGLTVSSLPINTNLLGSGLLNNPDSQFLFSGIAAPGFVPKAPVNARFGDVTVQPGARLNTVGEGGRILLAGPNVTNGGTISAQSGQAVLAAGLQVGVAAHDGADPSLRGLDVWIGKVGDVGNATNAGLIETLTGSALMAGRYVNQLGVIESSTSVNLNGRIDLLASYGAVSNPNYAQLSPNSGGRGPQFFNQFTGVVTLGEGSVTRILPDYLSDKVTPGSALPQRSQINMDGQAIYHGKGSILLAPNAEVTERAGTWPTRDLNDNGVLFGDDVDNFIPFLEASGVTNTLIQKQKFFSNGGQIFVESGAVVNVAGSVDVFSALAQNILTVKLLGAELADSPLQRGTDLRGQSLTVDIRDSGVFNGRFWVGTPLGDVTGLAGLIERNAAQLTVAGGNISLQAGDSVVVSAGATLDVSGGFLNYEAGVVQTSSLISNGRLVAIRDATPDRVYDGIFTGETTFSDAKWGVTNTYKTPLIGSRQEASYVQGAAGGKLTITAPSMALDGELRGVTVEGTRQQVTGTPLSKLTLNFEAEKLFNATAGLTILKTSPTSPAVIFAKNAASQSVPVFSLASDDAPAALAADRLATVVLTQKLLDEEGFGALEVVNPEGSITVAADAALKATPKGSVALAGANISVFGGVEAVGGQLAFTAYNQSPNSVFELIPTDFPSPPVAGRGTFTLGSGGRLSVAGSLVDDAISGMNPLRSRVVDGGTISIQAYNGVMERGSELDVSGGAYVSPLRDVSYGKGGKIAISTGSDPGNPDVLGGKLVLDSTLSGYSGAAGGTLNVKTSRVQVGGVAQAGVLTLDENFFRRGGFTNYEVTGIGALVAGTTNQYQPAVTIAAGAQISTAAESLRASFDGAGAASLERVLNVEGLRTPVNVSFKAAGADVSSVTDNKGLEVRGDLRMETGSRLTAEPGAMVSFSGDTVSLFGSVIAPGGSITVKGEKKLPVSRNITAPAVAAFETVRLGATAQLSTAGSVVLVPDAFGRRVGKVYDGGKISVAGNIIAENGAVLDVRGTSGTLDLDPLTLAQTAASSTRQIRGLLRPPQQFLNVATRVDSNGGQIGLAGGEILQSDATLLGAAGGSTAIGGSLSISSGRFINVNVDNSTADSNLTVVQSGSAPGGSGGFFALDRFQNGGFDSLALNGGVGGNVEFSGRIDLNVRGALDLAGGGVIRANDMVNLTAGYLAVGQDFLRPSATARDFFTRTSAGVATPDTFTPTVGSGNLNLSARFIDVGNLALLGIGNSQLTAANGDIRGNGTLSVAGNLTLSAAQIYPTTLRNFDIFAYDSGAVKGSVTVNQNGMSQAPLSAGGSLGIYASRISQNGTLRAPLGTIRLGWDGVTGAAPLDPITGLTSPAPVAELLELGAGSVTSVSALGLEIPFGVSPDGGSWISPAGADITQSGVPEKSVVLAGETVNFAAGATVDLRGGGDVFASRFVAGNGGIRDLLGAGGQTGSAESFAIVPGYSAGYAPFGDFGPSQGGIDFLGASPAYASAGLKVGDVITLDASSGLPAGTYTLLPRGYALLKGAFLVTPSSVLGNATVVTPEGASLVSGYRSNGFNPTAAVATQRSRFELVSGTVLAKRANYALLSANDFFGKSGGSQPLPQDAGSVSFLGKTSLLLEGSLLTQAAGRGARADISSQSDFFLTNGSASGPGITLNTDLLSSWNVDSLLVGGTRRRTATGTVVDVATGNLTLDNAGGSLIGNDIVLVAKEKLTLSEGSSLVATGAAAGAAEFLTVNGDGALVRVSRDETAGIFRSGATGASGSELSLGAGSTVAGSAVILDSSYGNFFSPQAVLDAKALTLSSGQISVVFDGATGVANSFLTLSGVTLAKLQQASSLKLQSASSIDFFGAGVLGGAATERLTLTSGGLRGDEQGTGEVVLRAGEVRFENPQNVATPSAPSSTSGSLRVDADRIVLGENATTVSGYQDVMLGAQSEILTSGKGSFFTVGNLQAVTAQLSGGARSDYAIRAGQAVTLTRGSGVATASDVLGAQLLIEGASVAANSNILLPSGKLTLRATSGALDVGGNLSVEGRAKTFYDVTRFADAGEIVLEATTGNVTLAAGSQISVAAAASGGDAGSLKIKTPLGIFNNAGTLLGQAGAGGRGGDFSLDSSSIAAISDVASASGFTNSQAYRARNGDVAVAGNLLARQFSLAADQGSILVTGRIDASGETGGSISLAAHQDLVLASGAVLDASGRKFNSAGKGGAILLEAGTQRGGVANASGLLDLQSGSSIQLGVQDYVAGRYFTPGSSEFEGKFTGTLHLRAPRTATNDEVRVDAIESEILGASAVIVEGSQIYTPAGGVLNIALRNQINADNTAFLGAVGTGNANELAITNRLLTGAANAAAWSPNLVLAAGVEIINPSGDLTLGLANPAGATATNTAESRSTGDWDLSGFRYGSKGAAGVLTLRATGDLVFNNALSDGFTPVTGSTTARGNSNLWLATLTTIQDALPTNAQSWSYRLTAGADLDAGDFRSVQSADALALAGKGSVNVGEFYPAVPNALTSGTSAGVGQAGQTADSIRISTDTSTDRGTRYEVIRTGTGDITVSAGTDIQLRNQFASIYTAGVALPTPTTIYSANDFVLPVLPTSETLHPRLSGSIATQQLTQAAWSLAGGNVSLSAQQNIGRYTLLNSQLTLDSTRELPSSWLYRRSYVDALTGRFSDDGGFGTNPALQNALNIHDKATSTTWWVDFTNFFQGAGALGGGNVTLTAGNDVANVDAVTPTNARMVGRRANPDFTLGGTEPEFINVAADASNLLELGGGDVTVRAGRNIDGGVYYVERGEGSLFAGGAITTNAARSSELGLLLAGGSVSTTPTTWLPTTLFVGKSSFDVTARGDVLLGQISNPFLLPQNNNNKFWYKTYFNTFAPDAGADVASYSGDVAHQSGGLAAWLSGFNISNGGQLTSIGDYQPWLRLALLGGLDSTVNQLNAPNLRSTAFAGNLNLGAGFTLAPSAIGSLELVAGKGIQGGNVVGSTGFAVANINLSDASPNLLPSVTAPLAYQSILGANRTSGNTAANFTNILANVSAALTETGATRNRSPEQKRQAHGTSLTHAGDANPVRLYAVGQDISGVSLFSPKETRIIAQRDITDIEFYLQNNAATDVSLVSAGRDIRPYDANTALRQQTLDDLLSPLLGDIQINGPGVVEVLAGQTLDLGTGLNGENGVGVGLTSVGNLRNPNLPFEGADIIAQAGLKGSGGVGPALGLANSSIQLAAFIARYIDVEAEVTDSPYLEKIQLKKRFKDLTAEQQAIVAQEKFFTLLREAGRKAPESGFQPGYDAVQTFYGDAKPAGDILTRSREIRTTSGGAITLGSSGGNITMASVITGNPLAPPGVVTEFGGGISTFTDQNVNIGQARIFTLRGGDITMWSSNGNIAAGTSSRTVVTAPPTRVVFDIFSASVQTDLGGLATGGGIGVLAAVEGVKAGNVDLIAPRGFVDAGDAGIRVTGNLNIAAQVVLNAGNISASGTSTGASAGAVSAPSVATVTTASNTSAATGAAVTKPEATKPPEPVAVEAALSLISVEVVGYGGGEDEEEGKDKPAE